MKILGQRTLKTINFINMLQQLGWIFSKGTTRTLKHYEAQKVHSNLRKYLIIEKRIIQSNVQKTKTPQPTLRGDGGIHKSIFNRSENTWKNVIARLKLDVVFKLYTFST